MDLVTFGIADAVVGSESDVGFSSGNVFSNVFFSVTGDILLNRRTTMLELITDSVIMGVVPVDENGNTRKEPILTSEGCVSLLAKLVACKSATKLVNMTIDDLLSR